MFWGLANCPPETVERVLGNYNKIIEKSRLEEEKKRQEQEKKKQANEKLMEMIKKNPPKSFKDILEYTMICQYKPN